MLPKGLKQMAFKEIKELIRDPKLVIGMIILPALMFPLLGMLMGMSIETAKESAAEARIAIINRDSGAISEGLLEFLTKYSNLSVVNMTNIPLKDAVAECIQREIPALIYIPRGFSENVTSGSKGVVEIYAVMRGFNIAQSAVIAQLNSIVDAFRESVSITLISQVTSMDPSVVLHPIDVREKTVFRERVVDVPPGALFSLIMTQTTAPVMIMVVLIVAMQIAASSVAMEKEAKTLETMLSLPIGRLSILAGKLVGVVVMSLLGAISYMLGFKYYMDSYGSLSLSSISSEALSELNLALSPQSYIILAISIFLAMIAALAIAIVVSIFAEDVRSAQAMVGYLYMLVFIPMFALMYVDVKLLPPLIRYVLYAIPFTYSVLTTKAVFSGEITPVVVLGNVYVLLFTVILLYLVARIFSTEKILTARITLRRKVTT